MTKLGIIVLAATLAVLAAEFSRCRSRGLPIYGWLGLALMAAAEWLMFRSIQPVATYFTPIVWTAYLLVADAAVFAVRGRSRLHDAPIEFARLALLSIPLWLIFEAYNLRLANWNYIGLPHSALARRLGYAWSFATITPGILVTSDLIESFDWWKRPARPLRFSSAAKRASIALGAAFLILPLVVPRALGAYLFGLVWLGFLFLLDPLLFRAGLPSLEGDLAAGRRERLFSLLAAGWVCGLLWEFWNFWAAAKWLYIFPLPGPALVKEKIFEMPIPGYLGFLPFALECFVMSVFASWFLGWQKPAPSPDSAKHARSPILAALVLVLLGVLFRPTPVHAAGLVLPPLAKQGLDVLYAGQPEKAIGVFHQIETAQPENPLGYLLEAEARWWQIYCEACEIKWNMIDAWQWPRHPSDDAYLALTDKAHSLAQTRLAQGPSAEMEFYDGMSWLLRARLLGLRDDRRGTARAGVETRAHLLRSLELDPQMVDANAGLGLYNYYVDTLSPIAKFLRVFMGIPGGKKQDGVRQLRIAMEQGTLTRVEARFYLAKNLRNYDHDYSLSIETMQPLAAEYPQNPTFQLILGDTHAKLGHRELAAANFHAAELLPISDEACAQHVRQLAKQALALLR